jgi:hypothetical protein
MQLLRQWLVQAIKDKENNLIKKIIEVNNKSGVSALF